MRQLLRIVKEIWDGIKDDMLFDIAIAIFELVIFLPLFIIDTFVSPNASDVDWGALGLGFVFIYIVVLLAPFLHKKMFC